MGMVSALTFLLKLLAICNLSFFLDGLYLNNAGTKAIDRKRWKEGFKRREKARASEIERVKRESEKE